MDWLLRHLANWLDVKPAGSGEAITPQLRFPEAWPQGVTLLVVIGCAALIIWLYRRETSASLGYRMLLAGLRVTLVLLAVFMLSEAVLSVERIGLPYFIVVADDSASEQVVDQYADPKVKAATTELAKIAGKAEVSRFAVAQGWLSQKNAEVFRELRKNHRVRLYLTSSATRSLAEIDQPDDIPKALDLLKRAEATGSQSRLGDGVREILTELRGVPPSAILMLTDGQTTDGETLAQGAELARGKGVPLFTIGLGDREPARDLELTDLLVDEVVFVDDLVPFQAKLVGRGFTGQDVEVRLKEMPRDSTDPAAAKTLETIRVPAPPDGQPRKIEIGHRPKEVGEITYILEVDPQPRELRVDNNRIERTINVRKDKLKVLFVEGEPRYEYRYLKNFLERRNESIDLSVVLFQADPEYSEQDRSALPTFPAAREGKDGLFSYDVILFGDVDPSYLSQAQMSHIAEFVTEKGGGILFIAGEGFNPLSYKGTPLEVLLPIQLAEARNPVAVGNAIASFRPRLTVEGRTNPIFRFAEDEVTSAKVWDSLPELYWFLEAPRKAPAAFVLAEHPTLTGSDGPLPVMLYQFVGSGKSMLNAVDDTWRWRLRVGDQFFGRYWIQTLRFLARSKLLGQRQAEITTDRRRYQRNQPVQVRVRFPNPGIVHEANEVTVLIERKGQGPRRMPLKVSATAKNVFEGVLPQAQEGEYTVRLLPPPLLEGGMPTSTFRVEAPAGELERVQMNEPELRQAAELTGGKFYTPVETSTLLKDLPKPRKVPLDTDPPIPLWNTWPVLALFLVVLTAEWVLRKRKQMV